MRWILVPALPLLLLITGCASWDPQVIEALANDPAMVDASITTNTPWGTQSVALKRLQPSADPAKINADGSMATGREDWQPAPIDIPSVPDPEAERVDALEFGAEEAAQDRDDLHGRLDTLEDPPEVRLPAYANAVIVGAAVPEGAGLALITLGLLSASTSWIAAGGVAAAFLIWQGRPRADEIGL